MESFSNKGARLASPPLARQAASAGSGLVPSGVEGRAEPGSKRAARLQRSFTLVELLTVIAIITVLMALLFSALKAAREMGKGVKCLSNLHQIGQAFSLYSSDYEGYFPPLNSTTNSSIAGNPKVVWGKNYASTYDYLRSYTGLPPPPKTGIPSNVGVWICPNDSVIHAGSQPGFKDSYSYGRNINAIIDLASQQGVPNTGGGSNPQLACPYSITMINHPAECFLLSDAYPGIAGKVGPTWSTPDEIYAAADHTLGAYQILNHRGRVNCLFHDMHVEAVLPYNIRYAGGASGPDNWRVGANVVW